MIKHYRVLAASVGCFALVVYTSTVGRQSDAGASQRVDKGAASAPGKAATVEMHLAIRDAGSGFTLEAKQDVPTGTNAFEAICHIVVVDHKRVPGIGRFVTGLCGIEATRSQFWALYVNGDLSDKGISSIQLDADTEIEWKLQSRDALAR
jgi:Domain of unknown function (DUF4430)